MNFEELLLIRKSQRKGVFLEMALIDLCGGNILAGLMLSQILYWHEPNEHGQSKLRVCKNGKYWLAKKHTSWQEECRLTENQSRDALELLKKLGFIQTMVARFDGNPTTHIALVKDKFTAEYLSQCASLAQNQLCCSTEPNGPQHRTLTETTTEITITPLQSEVEVPTSTVTSPSTNTPTVQDKPTVRESPKVQRTVRTTLATIPELKPYYAAYRQGLNGTPCTEPVTDSQVKSNAKALQEMLDAGYTLEAIASTTAKINKSWNGKGKTYTVSPATVVQRWDEYFTPAKTPSIPRAAPPLPSPAITEVDTAPYTDEERLALRSSMWEAMWTERIHAASNGYFPDHAERIAYDASTDAQKAQSRAQGYVEGFCPVFEEFEVGI